MVLITKKERSNSLNPAGIFTTFQSTDSAGGIAFLNSFLPIIRISSCNSVNHPAKLFIRFSMFSLVCSMAKLDTAFRFILVFWVRMASHPIRLSSCIKRIIDLFNCRETQSWMFQFVGSLFDLFNYEWNYSWNSLCYNQHHC